MARRDTKIRQRNRGVLFPMCWSKTGLPINPPPDPSGTTWSCQAGRAPKEAASSPPCGPSHMDQGLPLRKFRRLRELGEENAKRISWSCGWKLFPQLLWPNCEFSFLWIRGRVCQPQHCGHLGLDNSMLQRAILCIIGCFTAIPAFT